MEDLASWKEELAEQRSEYQLDLALRRAQRLEELEQLRKSLSERKPATLWNTLELLRRIINFGVKTNRCPNLAFQIEMPVKDNEVIEHLTPEETRRFLDCARTWPARDVGNMLLLPFLPVCGAGRCSSCKMRTWPLTSSSFVCAIPRAEKPSPSV